ncbi:MAG TPA: PilZ domain-containing protein [Gaiellales bacterium]|nr:PilZ domain-containing protein [Gaiellales bacterium]
MTSGLPQAAAARLVSESAIEMETEQGPLEIWTISSDGRHVEASAPRLRVAVGMALRCRLELEGVPCTVNATVEEAEIRSAARAAVTLRIDQVAPDELVRRSPRVEMTARATLVALVCDRLVPNEMLVVTINNLSNGGFRASLTDTRVRARDRLRIRCRFLEGEIGCEVRVRWAMPTGQPGQIEIGCSFIDPLPDVQRILELVVARGNGGSGTANTHAIRLARATVDEPDERPALPRRLFPAAPRISHS